MEGLVIDEVAVISDQIVVLLGSAGVYQTVKGSRPYWNPELDYDKQHSPADSNQVQLEAVS